MESVESLNTTQIIGVNVDIIVHNQVAYTIWDVGSQEQVRPLWPHHFQVIDAVIFVLDASNRLRINEACDRLIGLLSEPSLEHSILIILANKQNLPNGVSIREIVKKNETG